MPPRSSLIVAACLALLTAAAMAQDMRIQLNPALASLAEQDPAAAQQALDDLLAVIEEGKAASGAPPKTRGMLDPTEKSLIDANPLIQEAYRIDPKAALEQLRQIVAAGGGG